MEGDRKTSSSIAGAAQNSPLFSGFSSSIGGSKEASIGNKHKTKSQTSTSQVTDHSGRKPQGSPTSRLPAHKRDTTKPLNQPEQIESPYFGSSVHYGARDFYGSPPSSKTSKNNQKEEGNDLGNQEFAMRGEWWQGSLYY